MTGAIEVRIIFLQSKTAKTSRRYLTGICVYLSQRHLRHLQNQTSAHEGGLSWVGERSSSTIPASRSTRLRRLPAASFRTFSPFMKAKRVSGSLQSGSGSGNTKTIKTAAATRSPDDSKARISVAATDIRNAQKGMAKRHPFLRIFSYLKVCTRSHS